MSSLAMIVISALGVMRALGGTVLGHHFSERSNQSKLQATQAVDAYADMLRSVLDVKSLPNRHVTDATLRIGIYADAQVVHGLATLRKTADEKFSQEETEILLKILQDMRTHVTGDAIEDVEQFRRDMKVLLLGPDGD